MPRTAKPLTRSYEQWEQENTSIDDLQPWVKEASENMPINAIIQSPTFANLRVYCASILADSPMAESSSVLCADCPQCLITTGGTIFHYRSGYMFIRNRVTMSLRKSMVFSGYSFFLIKN